MMMKLMKVLVVALVAGGVCAPVASQAGEVDGKAIMCEHVVSYGERTYTDEDKAEGMHLAAYVFRLGKFRRSGVDVRTLPRSIYSMSHWSKYEATPTHIRWRIGSQSYSLDRKILQLAVSRYIDTKLFGRHAQCELIDPDKIGAYFQPYIDYGNALDAKAMEDNKI
jgi:hypothetical protein